MYYPNSPQFQGNQPYAMMQRAMPTQRQTFIGSNMQNQQNLYQQYPQTHNSSSSTTSPYSQQQQIPTQTQQRGAISPQVSPNAQFMPMRVAQVNQNFMSGHPSFPYHSNSPLYNHNNNNNNNNIQTNIPVPMQDDRYHKQLIVNYIAPDVVSGELHELFSRFGPLDGARVIYDRSTSLPKGYGFVYFCHPEDAKAAVARMNGFEFHGKRLKVGYSTNPLNIISGAQSQATAGPYTPGAIV